MNGRTAYIKKGQPSVSSGAGQEGFIEEGPKLGLKWLYRHRTIKEDENTNEIIKVKKSNVYCYNILETRLASLMQVEKKI